MSQPNARRQFLQNTAAISTGLTILPSGLLAAKPNSKVNVASIGCGGMGWSDLQSIASHKRVNIVALCDLNKDNLARAAKQFPKAKTFTDYRVMFDQISNEFDAVHITTPDHMHASIAMTAINHKKHVYCQKPLCHTVDETRRITEAAKKAKVTTQMGIQIHSSVAYRMGVKLIQRGAIGKVKEVHSWSNKMWGHTGPAPQAATHSHKI